MPRAPKRCGSPGCEVRVVGRSYCELHHQAWLTSRRPGSTRASRFRRSVVLARDPTCRCPGCRACGLGCVRPSAEDDHLVPLHRGGTEAMTNHVGMCSPCHLVKTLDEARVARGGLRP